MDRLSLAFVVLSGLATFSASCATSASAAADESSVPDLPPYDGPKAKIALRKFDWKVGSAGGAFTVTTDGPGGHSETTISVQSQGYMTGLADMLTESLLKSNRFDVLERQQFGDIRGEHELREEGWVGAADSGGPKKGAVEAADIAIYGAVTEWQPDAGGSQMAGAGAGLLGGILGGAAGLFSKERGRCAINIRIFDMKSSKVLASETVVGEASSYSFGAGGLGITSGVGLVGGLGEYENKPMGKAVRLAIARAVQIIANKTPQRFFRSAPEAATEAAPAVAPAVAR